MRTILGAALLALALPAAAATASFPGGSCAFSVVTVDASGNVVVTCASSTPTTPPTQPPPVVVPPATPAPAVCGSGYTLRPLGPSGQTPIIQMLEGVVYASPLVAPTGAVIPSGFLWMTTTGGTPGGQMIEVGISPCPGDLTYYKTPAACYSQFGGMQCPCGGITQPESPGVKWAPSKVATDAFCIVPTGATWYVNYRMFPGAGPMGIGWNPR